MKIYLTEIEKTGSIYYDCPPDKTQTLTTHKDFQFCKNTFIVC